MCRPHYLKCLIQACANKDHVVILTRDLLTLFFAGNSFGDLFVDGGIVDYSAELEKMAKGDGRRRTNTLLHYIQ